VHLRTGRRMGAGMWRRSRRRVAGGRRRRRRRRWRRGKRKATTIAIMICVRSAETRFRV
jgi:hypothetical protein